MKKYKFMQNAQMNVYQMSKKILSCGRILIAASIIFIFPLCNMPVYAAEEEVNSNVQIIEESSSPAEYDIFVNFPDTPIAVYEVDNPYRIETVAMFGDVYQGTISDTILKYLAGFVEPFDDYIIYRSDQYIYKVIVGNDFQSSGSTVSGSGSIYSLTTNSNYNQTEYRLSKTEGNFSVNTGGSAYVYSNIEGYSDYLKEVRYEAFTTFGINAAFIFIAVRDVFKSIFR